jgi:hypothetical protein
MNTPSNTQDNLFTAHCCPGCQPGPERVGLSRRSFLSSVALGSAAMSSLTWPALAMVGPAVPSPMKRRPLVVKPILQYGVYTPRPQASWRPWGAVHSHEAAQEETARIKTELQALQEAADFPVQFLPVSAIRGPGEISGIGDLAGADTILIYAACGPQATFDELAKLGKDIIFFVRDKSGPHYLWYEILSPRYLRQHTDGLQLTGIDEQDVVVDDQDEILWRLRSLCGLRNTLGTRILAVGGPGAWSQPVATVAERVRKQWKFDIRTVSYEELGGLIRAARADDYTVELAQRRAEAYLRLPGTTLETKREFVDHCFLLDQVFRKLMQEADCRAITVHHCMGTIMEVSETAACLTLTTLNDDGYLAFCESDFVVIPSGILLGNITGHPVFLHNPTFPHHGKITLAHCTAPRKMDGRHLEPARIMTHYESDYGAAPKVEMRVGQKLTSVIPDFAGEFWQGLSTEIVDNPFLPICRSQIDVKFGCDSQLLAQRLRGFHWMTCYGDYQREVGYALKRIPVRWERVA